MDDRWNTTSVAETHADIISVKCRILTIILAALILGQVVFVAVIVFAMNGWNEAPNGMTFSLIGLFFSVQAMLLNFFVPGIFAKAFATKVKESIDQLLGAYQLQVIFGAAALEGAGFMNLCAFMQEHNKWSLVPVAVGIFLILMMIPTPMRVTNWLDEVRRMSIE